MKNILFLFLSMINVSFAVAQLKTKEKCPDFAVDILGGSVNGLRPNELNDRIKLVLPCFTSVTEAKDSAQCGTSVFFKDRDVYFYTQRDYIEIGPKFKGKLSLPLLGAQRNSLFKWLGNPKMKDDDWSAFQTAYGILVLHFDKANKVNKIQISTNGVETLSLCE